MRYRKEEERQGEVARGRRREGRLERREVIRRVRNGGRRYGCGRRMKRN